MSKKRILIFAGVLGTLIAVGVLGYILFRDPMSTCACVPNPEVFNFTQENAETMIGTDIPAAALAIHYRAYTLPPRRGGTEAYVDFKLPPVQAESFLNTLPALTPLPAAEYPFEATYYITNFGAIGGVPAIFDGSTYEHPNCDNILMVDRSSPDLYTIYLYAHCS